MTIGDWKTRLVFERYNIVSRRDLHDAAAKLERYIGELEKEARKGEQSITQGRGNPHFSSDGEAKCMRAPSARGERRLARGGVLDSTVSTASKRNEVMACLSGTLPVSR